MAKKSIVHLRVYKGNKLAFDENGTPLNENHAVKIAHGTLEWNNFLKMATKNGYCKVDVEKATSVEGWGEDEKISEISDVSRYKKEVEDAIKPTEVVLSPEQEQIKKLEEQNKALLERFEAMENATNKVKVPEVKITPEEKPKDVSKIEVIEPETVSVDNIDTLRDEYEKLNPEGKKAFNGWGVDALKEKIQAFKDAK